MAITANILASLAIDDYGILRMEQHPLNSIRASGPVQMVVGVALIVQF